MRWIVRLANLRLDGKSNKIARKRLIRMEKVMEKVIEFDEECPYCNGTGLYVGECERDGVATVCNICNGTGVHHYIHKYNDFTGKKLKKNVNRVIQASCGIICGNIDGSTEWCGGMTYEDWLSDKPFKIGMEMRKHTCPAWYYQSVDYGKKPDWKECSSFGSFSGCKCFKDKIWCWARWDKEYTK
jgi:hypothetical protein